MTVTLSMLCWSGLVDYNILLYHIYIYFMIIINEPVEPYKNNQKYIPNAFDKFRHDCVCSLICCQRSIKRVQFFCFSLFRLFNTFFSLVSGSFNHNYGAIISVDNTLIFGVLMGIIVKWLPIHHRFPGTVYIQRLCDRFPAMTEHPSFVRMKKKKQQQNRRVVHLVDIDDLTFVQTRFLLIESSC
jgi:hypothetical protein